VHNSIPEYASTASILKPFEKKVFEEVISPSIIMKIPEFSKRQSIEKRERKRKKKEKKEKEMLK
jgi:hypothetical protein